MLNFQNVKQEVMYFRKMILANQSYYPSLVPTVRLDEIFSIFLF